MHSLSRILVPIDFSERAVGAALCAKALSGHFHSQLTLLHVIPPPEPGFEELHRARRVQATREIEGFLADELAGLPQTRLVLEGEPAGAIVEFAHSQGTDLIVMPTHGCGSFRRFILGSNTAKVLHDANCPVWTGVHVPESTAVLPALRQILCAVDLGPQSGKALEWATWLQRECGAALTLMHAATAIPEPSPAAGTRRRSQIREAVEAELERLRQAAGAAAETAIETGEPAAAICGAARRLRADVVVIGRGSASGVYGRLRTNAYAIIREAPCPVVSV